MNMEKQNPNKKDMRVQLVRINGGEWMTVVCRGCHR